MLSPSLVGLRLCGNKQRTLLNLSTSSGRSEGLLLIIIYYYYCWENGIFVKSWTYHIFIRWDLKLCCILLAIICICLFQQKYHYCLPLLRGHCHRVLAIPIKMCVHQKSTVGHLKADACILQPTNLIVLIVMGFVIYVTISTEHSSVMLRAVHYILL